jgi:hypothetical protein
MALQTLDGWGATRAPEAVSTCRDGIGGFYTTSSRLANRHRRRPPDGLLQHPSRG